MKDGKPEVLIIGEAHPRYFLAEHQRIEERKIAKALKDLRISTRIIESEIKAAKKFRARRILFEYVRTDKIDIICTELRKTKNLELFQKKLYAELRNCYMSFLAKYSLDSDSSVFEGIERDIKIDSFIIGSTKIYDVGYFEDLEVKNARDVSGVVGTARELKKFLPIIDKEREKFMVKNISEQLIDRTVVICGASHVEAIKNGLEKVAYVHPPVRV